MAKSVIVKLDEGTYRELERWAHERGAPLEKALAEVIAAYLRQQRAYASDPFFKLGKAGRSGLGDLAEAHDKYLYGR